jgi:ribulose 1,5-bisphosphate synthetase/thiazole synthase
LFVEQFVTEMRQYEKFKNSQEYFPKVVRENSRTLLADFANTEEEVNQTLAQLATALIGFCKKVEETNARIFRHQVFEDILTLNSENKFETLAEKIGVLIVMLNYGAD